MYITFVPQVTIYAGKNTQEFPGVNSLGKNKREFPGNSGNFPQKQKFPYRFQDTTNYSVCCLDA